jgi:hypothetical protein
MENVKETGASTPSNLDGGQSQKSEPALRKRGLVMTTMHFVVATHVWKKQGSILRKRASFPLLRHVIKNFRASGRVLLPVEEIADEYLAKTILGHRIILTVSVLGIAWAFHLFVKGLAVAVRFDTPMNIWLICSLPMLLFTCANAAMSWKVHKQFSAEMARRDNARFVKGENHAQP